MKIYLFKPISFLLGVLFVFSGCGGGGNQTSDTTPPNFTTNSTVSIEENQIDVIAVHADDTSAVSYSITGGSDSNKFSINSVSGLLTFKTAPDYETPEDNNSDNNYEVTVNATDTSGNQMQQDITVTVTDFTELYANDGDGDSIPNDIEIAIGTNPNDNDGNNNGIEDGLETEDTYGDIFFDMQWHIHSVGSIVNDSGVETIAGNDLDLLNIYHSYMGYRHGDPLIIQVVDTGVDAAHEDLIQNMDLTRSYDGENVGDPSPNTYMTSYEHGTMVAGIMAARAFNGKGVRGIVPFARIAGSNWLETQGMAELEKVWLTGDGANEIAVTNNSWGSYYSSSTFYEDIMQQGTSILRDGKGRIYVFAAGNNRGLNGNANLEYSLSNRFVITVAALKHDNTHASYSNPGANILVSGYSGDYAYNSPTIGTTTVMGTASNSGSGKNTWDDDTNGNYTYAMNGTSSASPTVAASIALVLEACPNLTWRDIKYLIAKHTKLVDHTNPTWVINGAGLKHSIDYGFGLINAKGMIDACTSDYTNLPQERTATVTKIFNTPIADNNTAHSFTLNLPDNITIEWVEATIDNNSTHASDYRIELTSPQGTKTTLMTEGSQVSGNWMDGGFRLSTPAMMGESSNGTWTVDITDTVTDDQGTLKDITLKIYGH